jgi:hypothetical protein
MIESSTARENRETCNLTRDHATGVPTINLSKVVAYRDVDVQTDGGEGMFQPHSDQACYDATVGESSGPTQVSTWHHDEK